MTSPRVLHVLGCDDWGGTEVQVSTQIIEGDPGACRQDLVTLDPPGPVTARLRERGVAAGSLGGGNPYLAVRRLAGLLRRGRYDVVEAYGFRAGLVARAARVLAPGSKLVIGVRGLHFTEAEEPDGHKTRAVIAVERVLRRSVAVYSANSYGARDFLVSKGFPRDRFRVIQNGVWTDVPQASPGGSGPLRVVCTARFVPRKRHDVLLRAIRLLLDRGADVRLELIGYGITEEGARRTAEELGVSAVVTFLGRLPRERVSERLADAHVFALTSLWEGMPGSVLEAMAAGLPVVGTRVNGTEEVVRDRETGFLVPPQDEVATADALFALATDPALRARLGAGAREVVEQEHAFSRVVERKEALYAELASWP